MNLVENIRFALRALTVNKLRAVLTMLGIIIGVASVIALGSVGSAVESVVVAQFEGLGDNLLFIVPGSIDPAEQRRRVGGQGLTNADVAALSNPLNVPDVNRLIPFYDRAAIATVGDNSARTAVSGTTEDFPQVRNFYPEAGRFFDAQDVATGARVAVIGRTPYEALFPDGADPIGRDVKVNGVQFRIIGLMEEKGAAGFDDPNNVLLMPITTVQQRLFPARRADGTLRVDYILAQILDESRQDSAITQIELTLRETHGISFDEEDDFSVLSQADIVEVSQQITGLVSLFLVAIAFVSVVVGGIGIMNIMLVSVTERTREIGLRKAVGAKRGDILFQFLVESVTLALIGGVIGITLGLIVTWAVSLFSDLLQPVLTIDSVLLGFGAAAGVGIFFGIYPAWRAAGLNPIEALRYE